LADHGAREGNYEEALFSYNKSEDYVEEVMGYYHTYTEEGYELIQLPLNRHKAAGIE
jgi:peptidoglycan LD-endopeptidase LytH